MGMIIGAVIAILGIVLLAKGVIVIQQSQCMVIESLGRYSKTLSGGFNLIVPFIEQPRDAYWVTNGHVVRTVRIDMRETVLDVPQQSVITRDNVSIEIDALLYIQITNPVKAVYEISNLPLAVGQLAQTSLRNVIGEMDLDETLSSRDVINAKLKAILDDATDKWGTKVNRVELKNIIPPTDIQSAMEKQMQAERERRAQVLQAEGDKQSRIARSEGLRQEQINLAEGARDAQMEQAKGEANAISIVAQAKRDAIRMIKEELQDKELAAQFLIASAYLEKFGQFTQKPGDKVYIPYEASTALSAFGGIKDLLTGSGKNA